MSMPIELRLNQHETNISYMLALMQIMHVYCKAILILTVKQLNGGIVLLTIKYNIYRHKQLNIIPNKTMKIKLGI